MEQVRRALPDERVERRDEEESEGRGASERIRLRPSTVGACGTKQKHRVVERDRVTEAAQRLGVREARAVRVSLLLI